MPSDTPIKHHQLDGQRPARQKSLRPGIARDVPTQIDAEVSSVDVALLHANLHTLTVLQDEDSKIREGFLKQIMEHAGAVGVAHIILTEDGNWDLKPHHSLGRVPRRHDFIEKFGRNCDATIQRQAIQIESFLGLQAVFAPVQIAGTRPEVLLVLAQEASTSQTLFVIEIVLEYFALWIRHRNSNDNGWKLTSLAALVELVSDIERSDTVKSACELVANELIRHLQCKHVVVGHIHKGKMRVQAISGQSDTKTGSDAYQLNETALNECWLRDETGTWPANENNNQHLLLAHKQLAKEFDYEAVLSIPLRTPGEDVIGAILIASDGPLILGNRLPNFVRAAAPRIASAIEVVSRAEISRARKIFNGLKQKMSTVKGRIWFGLAVVLLGVMLVPVPYRVRCRCKLDATTRRYAVAPFDGLVKRGFVQPGDLVETGQLLASMDGQALRFRMTSIRAELAKARKHQEIELSNRNIPGSLVAELEATSLQAEQDLLRFQEEQIEIRSPIAGMVLSGSLENNEGASASTGQVLYEVGPLGQLTVEITIPAEEIAHIQQGQNVRVWIDGFESQSFSATIQRVSPRSELRDARNVFVAELTIANPEGRFRPGMKGDVRVDCRSHLLVWNIFHKPWNYVVSRLTWW